MSNHVAKARKYYKLNRDYGKQVQSHGYELDGTKRYLINPVAEVAEQNEIYQSMTFFGYPVGWESFRYWLVQHGFGKLTIPKEFIAAYYGKAPLWKTPYSQGIVVMDEDGDYYIVVECSRENRGFAYTQILIPIDQNLQE